MSNHEYHLIALGWSVLIIFLTVFWYATLSRMKVILKERLSETRSHQSVSSLSGVFLFLFRGEFKQTGDERLVSVCARLRSLLYGYIGGVGAYIVFLVIMHPRL
jgi:hypothetical protein